jgi:flagellar biosynthesis protein FlhF
MMKIKKFTAPSIPEALRRVRSDMGEDALILGTSRRAGKGDKPNTIEVVAALDPSGGYQARTGGKRRSRGDAQNADGVTKLRKINSDIAAELKQIEERLRDVLASLAMSVRLGSGGPGGVEDDLVNAGFDPLLTRDRLPMDRSPSDPTFDGLVRSLVAEVPIAGPPKRISAFVGPSGSGKTTTVLKMVKRMFLPAGKKPRVVFFGSDRRDTSWLRDQCRTLGVKFVKAERPAKLEKILRKHTKDPILVDTPSISEFGEADLRFLVEAAKSLEDMDIRLVIDSTMDPLNICAIASCIPRSTGLSLVLTKLDEATRIGGAISAAITTGMPIAYVTGGRSAGDGIFVPDTTILSEKILDGLGGRMNR